MGYALLQVQQRNLKLLQMDAVRLNKNKDMYERLLLVHQTMQDIISRYRPEELAIEAPFFGKNVQSMLKLGRAQGVAIAAAMQRGLPVAEYSPRRIKQAITGNGNATKEKVWETLQHILTVPSAIQKLDASDALAVAVCHHFSSESPAGTTVHGKKKKGWDDFLRENPGRIVK